MDPGAHPRRSALGGRVIGLLASARLSVRALRAVAVAVELQRMFVDREPALARDRDLPLLDLGVEEFLDVAALQADEVIVVATLVQFEDRLPALEVMPRQQAGLLELREHAVDGREPDVHAFGQEDLVDVFGGQMALVAVLEQIEDLQPRQRGLQADGLEIVR